MKNKKDTWKPKVSIIIPCHNSGETLLRAVLSSQNQTYSKVETIIVNDCSTDQKTVGVLSTISGRNTKIINLKKNVGLPGARNTGFSASSGELVMFLDADDWLDSDAIELMVELSSSVFNKFFVYSDIFFEGVRSGPSIRQYREFSQLSINKIPYAIMIPKKYIDWVHLYDEDMKIGLEDWNLNLKLLENHFVPIRLNKPVFHYYVSPKGMLSALTKKHFFTTWDQIQQKRRVIYDLGNLIDSFRTELTKYGFFSILLPSFLLLVSKFPYKHVLDFFFFRVDKFVRFLRF